jgi:hypothetical protein
MTRYAWLPLIFVLGCNSNNNSAGDLGPDQGVNLDGGQDGAVGAMCSNTDPMNDGQDCPGNHVCPPGQQCVQNGASFKCFLTCQAASGVQPSLCPCDRACEVLSNDGGVVGAACIVANTAGERCGSNGGTPIFGTGTCAQNLFCAGAASGPAYCLRTCTGQADCSAATTCMAITTNTGGTLLACTYNYGSAGIPGNTACHAVTDTCQTGFLCDGTACLPQCNGPGDATSCTAPAACQQLIDPASQKTIGYICK